jgi:2-desacetyl-2-hydroxyethyl bacteriochlorophyllide A dehydrogenase
MNRTALFFESPLSVRPVVEALADNRPGELLVQTTLSAISSGTEVLVFKGEIPAGEAVDASIAALSGDFAYPLKYGYALVGRVITTGGDVDPAWIGREVFAFHPHESHFWARPDELLVLPPDIDPLEAVFLANTESALNFLMDARPLVGETVVVFGQGVVGLLTTGLLNLMPLGRLVTLDRHPLRRSKSLEMGAHAALDPENVPFGEQRSALWASDPEDHRADLVFELSGNPLALNHAIACCGYGGRILIGSWYGSRRTDLDLSLHFHRSRIRLISSQVSTVAPDLCARWAKSRRLQTAWEMIRRIRPASLVTHRFPIEQAQQAFELLTDRPEETLQVLLTYGDS